MGAVSGAGGTSGTGDIPPQLPSETELPPYPVAPESFRNIMLSYFGIERTDTNLAYVDGMCYEMEMGAYNFLKDIFDKSREKRKEGFRKEQGQE